MSQTVQQTATPKRNVPGEQYIPFVPANLSPVEFSILALFLGIILAVIFAAANAYVGLKVGMTVSASIPAAVMSMGILRGILKKKSILENNIVQTIASAGESLAAGVIFTIPAIFLWAKAKTPGFEAPSFFYVFSIAIVGGFLGVAMMIPIRRYLIVKEHLALPFPEGTACADVLMAGETGGSKAASVFMGLGVGALFSYLNGGLKLFATDITFVFSRFKNSTVTLGLESTLMAVGFVIGPRVAAIMFAGALFAMMVLIPLVSFMADSASAVIAPGTKLLSEMSAGQIKGSYIRYIGVGAVTAAGIISLCKSLPSIIGSFKDAMKGFSFSSDQVKRTERDISMPKLIAIVLALVIAYSFIPGVTGGFVAAVLMAIFSFFFVTVSARLVGLIGNSSNPLSGMTIATLLFTTLVLKASGIVGTTGMMAAISIGGAVCCAAAIAGDNSQDLKTGFLVGATPSLQQWALFVGVGVSAIVIGPVLMLLDKAYGFGSDTLNAPQASLMKLVIEGVFAGNLQWNLVFVGAMVTIVIELLGIPSMPFALGLYLPISTSSAIFVGGLVRAFVDKTQKAKKDYEQKVEGGILVASGMIAGGGLMGVIIALFVVLSSSGIGTGLFKVIVPDNPLIKGAPAETVGLIMFLLIAVYIGYAAISSGKKPVEE